MAEWGNNLPQQAEKHRIYEGINIAILFPALQFIYLSLLRLSILKQLKYT